MRVLMHQTTQIGRLSARSLRSSSGGGGDGAGTGVLVLPLLDIYIDLDPTDNKAFR